MRYLCMCFGWYQELLREAHADGVIAAESKLIEMLEDGGMIVHCYRETDLENPELVGRHRRLRFFVAPAGQGSRVGGEVPHQIERFLLDFASLETWKRAINSNRPLEGRWSVVELWSLDEERPSSLYGKATLISPPAAGGSDVTPSADGSSRRIE